MNDAVVCATCGKPHPINESELVFSLPDEIYALSAEERSARCDISADVCAVDRERFFLRGLLPLKVSTRSRPYRLGVWAEIASSDYKRIYELWSDPDQSAQAPIPGRLANGLPLHQAPTLGLAISIQLTGPKTRPEFFLARSEHPLFEEQEKGISEHRAIEYSDRSCHSDSD